MLQCQNWIQPEHLSCRVNTLEDLELCLQGLQLYLLGLELRALDLQLRLQPRAIRTRGYSFGSHAGVFYITLDQGQYPRERLRKVFQYRFRSSAVAQQV
jgi:hypothetical protein